MKKYILMILFFLFSVDCWSQTNETASLNIRASLKRGISVLNQNNILSFGEIILSGSSFELNKSPQEGLRFKIFSDPAKPVMISYSNVELNLSTNSGNLTTDNLLFVPKVYHTGGNSDFIDPVEVFSGIYYQPQNQSGEGILNLWIGGTLKISQSNIQGDYSGTLIITIAY